jgi:AraC family transcriptional regulator, transcriptional activator of the genes for pyochelin and ferripyochelin receptors
MNLEITSNTLPDVLSELCSQAQFCSQAPNENLIVAENEIKVPGALGSGKLSAHVLRNGIEFFAANSIEFWEKINVDFTHKHKPCSVGFTFIGAGAPVWRLKDYENSRINDISKGAFLMKAGIHEELILPPQISTVFYNIVLQPEFFEAYMNIFPSQGQDMLLGLIEKKTNSGFIHLPELSLEIRNTLNQLYLNGYSGMLKNIFLESKILELITLFFGEIDERKESKKLRKVDANRIYEAANILQNDMDNPPSVLELARTVGINETKLRLGFKSIFNSTVYDYLRKIRMQEAKLLILDKEFSVSEAGTSVGYSNISHFARAFKQEFGMNPGELLKLN